MIQPDDPIAVLNGKRIAERTARIEKETGRPAWERGLSDEAIKYLKTVYKVGDENIPDEDDLFGERDGLPSERGPIVSFLVGIVMVFSLLLMLASGLGALASFFAMIASVIHFQILSAIGYFVLVFILFFIFGIIAMINFSD